MSISNKTIGNHITDKERLDFLQRITRARDGLVVCRDSTTGRGWRLHELTYRDITNGMTACRDVRKAIDNYMRSYNNG